MAPERHWPAALSRLGGQLARDNNNNNNRGQKWLSHAPAWPAGKKATNK